MRIVVVERLDEHEGRYRFEITHDSAGSFVLIPGHGGGRDGPTIPDHPEQEAWMRARSGLKEVWHLTWEIPDGGLQRFLAALDASAGGGVLGSV